MATSPVFKTNLTFQCQMYLIHGNCWDQSLTFSGLHFFWTMSNYSSSSLHCGDIWKVNEITSLTALPTLQRKSAPLLLVVNIVLFQSTPHLILVVPLSRWAFTGKMISVQWLVGRWARGSLWHSVGRTLWCSWPEFVHWAVGCLRLKERRCQWPLRGGFGLGVAGWRQEGRCWFTCLPVYFLWGGSVSIYCTPWRFDISIRCYRQ